MRTLNVMLLSGIVFTSILISCEKNKEHDDPITRDLTGYVQKGPYLNGTTITVYELNSDLSQTGKIFASEISDNKGTFTLNDLALTSQFVELHANGFYFNENSGQNSSTQLTLSALSDLTDKSSLNVNVLTHLEKNRVIYLVSTGMSFADAKHQALQEILSIFEISKPDIISSELLDISKEGKDNAILLTVSAILQGNRTVAELTELLANIITDIREDGQLNSESIGTDLINDAMFLDTADIKYNLKEKYNDLGVDIEVPPVGSILMHFIENTDFEYTSLISYPDNGATGPNLLASGRTEYVSWPGEPTYYYGNSMTAIAPDENSISVRFTIIDTCDQVPPACDSCAPACVPCGQSESCGWGIDPIGSGWEVTNPSYTPMIFVFTKDFTKETPDAKIGFNGHGKAFIEIFENNSEVATRSKYIKW
jgi:hypothetical protein